MVGNQRGRRFCFPLDARAVIGRRVSWREMPSEDDLFSDGIFTIHCFGFDAW
ncbi:hypothetical protein C1M06_10755, partial [Neisseria gonorrhoeae]